MITRMKLFFTLTALVLGVASVRADIVANATFFDISQTATVNALVTSSDLLQTAVADPTNDTSATTTGNEAIAVGTRRFGLFNGVVGDGSSNTNLDDYLRADNNDTLSATFDTSVNTLGYDITGITGVGNWNDRADIGFSVQIGFVGGGTATLLNSGFWADQNPQDSTQHYAVASFVDSSGGVLNNNLAITDDAGTSIAPTGVVATGVESITFTFNNLRNPGILGEIDVIGVPTTATIPEPSSLALLGGLSGLLIARRRKV